MINPQKPRIGIQPLFLCFFRPGWQGLGYLYTEMDPLEFVAVLVLGARCLVVIFERGRGRDLLCCGFSTYGLFVLQKVQLFAEGESIVFLFLPSHQHGSAQRKVFQWGSVHFMILGKRVFVDSH